MRGVEATPPRVHADATTQAAAKDCGRPQATGGTMNGRRILEIGGLAAAVVLIAFGIGALALSIDARNTVSEEVSREAIVGSPDMNPADIKTAANEAGLPATIALPTCNVADKPIENGADARCFAQYLRIHALESSGGLTYAQMGRFVSAAAPTDPKGTSDEAAALMADGKPVSNGARNTWITATALATALNVSYMAEQIALFGLIVGIALLLSGIGFLILAIAVLGGAKAASKTTAATPIPKPVTP